MNHQDKMDKLRAIFDHCLKVADAKGRDYSGTEDSMSNFRDFGWKGIVVRLGDKYHRLKNLTKVAAAVKDESVDDTLYDMINYSALTLVQKASEVPVGPTMLYDPMTGRVEKFRYKNDVKHHPKCTCWECTYRDEQLELPHA